MTRANGLTLTDGARVAIIGGGPAGSLEKGVQSFDDFLLRKAIEHEVRVKHVLVDEVRRERDKTRLYSGGKILQDCDLFVGAFGVKASMGKMYEKLKIGCKVPSTIKATQSGIEQGEDSPMAQKYSKPHRFLYLTVIFWFILVFLFQTSFLIPHTIAAENTIIIIRSQQIAAYNEAIKGFEKGCKGKNISIKAIYDLNGDTEEGERIIQNIKESGLKPRVILAIGVLAATLVKEQFTDIPIIFCMVINHERFNLQGSNITGISSEASIEDQFTILEEILGKHKNVGVIYDPGKTGKIISEAAMIAKKFEFHLIKTEVSAEKEVASALKNIINKIDALWMIPDRTVITKNTLNVIAKTTTEHRLPIFCTSDAIVKAGALISISPNYVYTGLQAAQMAQTLLNDPATTSLGIKQPKKLKLTLNTRMAEIIGINPSSIKYYPEVVLYPQ